MNHKTTNPMKYELPFTINIEPRDPAEVREDIEDSFEKVMAMEPEPHEPERDPEQTRAFIEDDAQRDVLVMRDANGLAVATAPDLSTCLALGFYHVGAKIDGADFMFREIDVQPVNDAIWYSLLNLKCMPTLARLGVTLEQHMIPGVRRNADRLVKRLAEMLEAMKRARTPDEDVQTCPRRMGELGPWKREEGIDRWEYRLGDGPRQCSFCGGLHPDDFLDLVERGEARMIDTDKRYKWYVETPHGRLKWYLQHGFTKEENPEWVSRAERLS